MFAVKQKGFTQHLFDRDRRHTVSKSPKKGAGFTLIEVVIVLAISSLLTLLLFGLYSGEQRRARFADAIEGVVSQLDKVKSEVNAGFSTGSGTNANKVFFGRAVIFSPASGSYQVQTLSAANQPVLSTVTTENQSPVTIPWRVQFTNADNNYQQIVFSRNFTDGQLKTYIIPAGLRVDLAATYSAPSLPTQATLHFIDPTGLRASITIDTASGHIRRTYDN